MSGLVLSELTLQVHWKGVVISFKDLYIAVL